MTKFDNAQIILILIKISIDVVTIKFSFSYRYTKFFFFKWFSVNIFEIFDATLSTLIEPVHLNVFKFETSNEKFKNN
jgi:hypothetical protein